MNIVIVGTAYPLRGGIAHYIALLYKHLAVRHSVRVVTFTRQYPAFLFPGKSQVENESEGVVIPTERLIDSVNPLSWVSAARSIAASKPDLLIFKYWLPFFGPCFGSIAALVRRWTGAKVLFICDNVIPHEHRPGDRLFTRFAFNFVDFFIVQSHAVERELQEFWHRALYRFAPHPVYELFGRSISKARARASLRISAKHVMLFFGYIRDYKGLDTLLQALAIVTPRLPVKLLVVGEFYESERHTRQLIASLGLRDSVQLVPEYVPNDRVGMYFSASDVVVLPYRSATQSGIAQIAYQFDKPVIATDVGGLAEVVLHGTTGYVVPPEDPESLASAILRFYDERREKTFAAHVKREKQRYGWQAFVAQIEELMKSYGRGRR